MKIAVFGNKYQQRHLKELPVFFGELRKSGLEILIEGGFHDYLTGRGVLEDGYDSVAAGDVASGQCPVDLVLTLGGDGTLLHVSQQLRGLETPVLGVNTGHLGYLTSASTADAATIASLLLEGRLNVEHRTMLEVERIGGPTTIGSPHALNEVAILRHDTSSMIEMKAQVNDVPLTTYKGDGLVVSTPSGSTAYNMSAGGPILEPTTACIVLTPVSPHTLNMRPLVVRDDAVITITVRSRASRFQVSVDGNSVLCPSGTTVRISKSPHVLRLANLGLVSFADKLRTKLLWGRENEE